MNQDSVVYKILNSEAWDTLLVNSFFSGSLDDQRDGYIHLSSTAQLSGTLHKHFSNQRDLVLLEVKASSLEEGGVLKWEPSRNSHLFPHLYGKLRLASVITARTLPDSDEKRQALCAALLSGDPPPETLSSLLLRREDT